MAGDGEARPRQPAYVSMIVSYLIIIYEYDCSRARLACERGSSRSTAKSYDKNRFRSQNDASGSVSD